MKALSLWQPWASLIASGAKRYETRSWATKYRGPLLICAAIGGLPKRELFDILAQSEFQDALNPKGWSLSSLYANLPYGSAVAIAILADCIRTEDMTKEQIGTDLPFGDFSPGRYAWKLEHVHALREPFYIKGRQGLFNVKVELTRAGVGGKVL